jgi:hypothetical protein
MTLFSAQATHGYLGNKPDKMVPEVVIAEGIPKKIIKLKVYEFSIEEVDDPVLYISEPLINWEKSEPGKYVMSVAVEPPAWRRHLNYLTLTTSVAVTAKLYEEDAIYYALKWK